MVYIYNGTLLSQNKEQNNVICTNIDGPRDCQTEWSQLDRKGQIVYGIA